MKARDWIVVGLFIISWVGVWYIAADYYYNQGLEDGFKDGKLNGPR